MKLDGATIPIEARGLSASLALAARLYREDFRQLLPFVLAFAVPSCVVAWWLCRATESGLWLSLAYFHMVSPLLGACLVAAEGPRAFGEPVSWRASLAMVRARFGRLLASLWPLRLVLLFIGALFLDAPEESRAVLFVVLLGPVFLVFSSRSTLVREVILLEQLSGRRLSRRLADLRRGDSTELFGRHAGTLLCFVVWSLMAFVILDLASGLLLGTPLFIGRFSGSDFAKAAPWLLSTDARVVVALQAIFWLLYPIARLTLFLCYLDIRIRKECWDLELDFRVEARRLEPAR